MAPSAARFLSRNRTLALLPNARAEGLCGGVQYWDGQFNDARLALALARSAASQGALLVNYCRADDLISEGGKVVGLRCTDVESGQALELRARCVINATGVWVDDLRQKDGEANRGDGRRPTRPMVAPSQGVHMVVDREFLAGDNALMVPKTADGRVLFAVPWLGKVILGTTDTPRSDLAREPDPFQEEVEFILTEAARYLRKAPTRADVRSVWVGLRPLVKPQDDDGGNTKGLSREHTVLVSRSGLVTVTGGKWTTYRAMAEDVLQTCFDNALLPERAAGATLRFRLAGAQQQTPQSATSISLAPGAHSYGDDQSQLQSLPGAGHWLAPGLSEAMVRFAARFEYARTVEDMLARRSRLLFLDARAALALGPPVAEILHDETACDPRLAAFQALAQKYLLDLAPVR